MILNKTRKHNERYKIIEGGMGHAHSPLDSPNYDYRIICGIKGKWGRYPRECAVDKFITENNPDEVKENIINFLKSKGYENWLKRMNLI